MAFTRKFLSEQGVPEDKIEIILAERNRTMNDYILKADVQSQIDTAVEEAKKNINIDVTTTKEYIDLQNRVDMLQTLNTAEFENVKKPYREIVWGKLDHGENHMPYDEQMKEIAQTMPDLFVETKSEDEEEPKPQFASGTNGTMPSGKETPAFNDFWKFKSK